MAMIGSVIEKQRTQGVTSKHAQAKKEKQAAAQAKSTTHKSTISKAELPKTETVKTAVKLPGKTSGGFYSQPDLFSAAEEKKARMESARNTMNQKAQEFRLANNQVERISGSLKEQEDRIAKLSAAASSGARFAKSLYDVARKNYTDTYNKYETATAAAQKAAADYEPLYGLYAAAWEDYSSYITDQGAQYDAWRATIRSADDVAAEIDQLDKQIESTKKKLTAAQMRNQYAGQYDAAAGFPEWVNNEAGDIAAMEAELKNLQDQRALLGEESEWAKYFGYEEIRNAPDFAEKSQYKPTENGKEEKFNALSGMYTETGFDDITYDFINKNQKAMEHQMVNDISNNASFLGLDQNFLKQMTDDEVRIFNYLYATDGPEKAYAYISDLEADLTKRQRTAEEAQWQQYAKDSPVGSSVFSVLESPLKGLSYLGQIADYAADQKMDQNAGYNKFSYLNTAIRDEVSQDIEKNWGGVGSFAYQTGMSMADFLFNTALSGGNQALALGIMGSGAAADTTIRSKDRGLTDGQAMALGTIAGLAEVITEKVSMDALLKGDWTKSALGFIGKNVLAEGSEEGAADLINIFADVLISKDKSEWSQSIEEYKKQGMNEQDAFLKALEDQLLAIGLDMLGGGISGGVLSGGRVAIGKAGAAAQNAENTKAAGAAIRSMGDNMIDAIIEQGMEFDKTTKSHELAVKAREKRAAGKTLSDAEIGRLYQETSRELDREEAKASETAQRTQDQAPAAEETTRQTSEEEVEEPVQEAQLQTEAQRRLTETAAQYGVDAKTTARVRRISDAVKRNVEFYQDEDAAQNGYYDRSTGTIFVNANSKNPVAQIIGHELTHSIEDAGSYQKLQAVVFRQMERNGINLEQLRQKKKELYARHGVELNDQTAIDSEIVAQYMEKNLLTDETSIRALVKDDRTVGQKIMDQIDKLLAALGNKNAQERVFLTKARRIYADALNETAQGTQDQAPAAEKKSRKQRRAEEEQQQRDKQAERTEEKVRSTTMDKEELAAAYAAGEITEEEFDSAMESIMSDENEAGEDLLGKPVEYSIDENYARDIEEWDRAGRPDGEIFIMGDTGDVLQGLGAMDQDIYIRSEKISTILQEHQEMSLEEIKRIPEILDDPVLVLKSRNRVRSQYGNRRLVLFGTVKATDGRPVLCTLDLRPVENGLLVDDMQKVNSAYTKDVKPEEFLKRSDVLYADKKRTGSLLRDVGFKRPASLLRSGSMGSISYSGKSVNLEGVPFEQVVDTGSNARRYSFGGENARRADLDALEQAKKMELQGVAADTIFRETGWFTGADGKWRFEIDDSGARYDPRNQEGAVPGQTLADFLQHDELFKNYPQLRKTRVEFEDLGRGLQGSYKNPSQNPDIRYSVEDQEAEGSQEQEAQEPTQENQAQEQEIQEPDVISALPKKAQGYLTAAERRMVNAIGNAMNVPYRARRDFLQTISREISTEYLKNGKISEETMNGLFAKAYEEGRVVDEEFYTQYKDLKEYLRTVPVTISQEDASDITDYEDFRRAAFGRLRIVNEGGTPVDVVYEELRNMARELFPGQLTHPADQLERMLDVAKSIQRSEKNLDEFYGENAGEFKRWAKNEFETAVSNVLSDLRNVKRYAEDRAAKQSFEPSNLTQEQVMELYQDLKKKRKDQEKAIAKNLLTSQDEKHVNELLRGKITLESLNPETDNVKGIRQVYEARQAFEDVAKKIRAWNAERRGALNDQADKFLETANEWKDKGAGILYSREIMERNIQDIVPDEELADEIIKTYFTPVHKAAADANRLKNRMRDKVREMGLSQKVADGNLVSEAHAVQLLGEAEDNIRVLENTRGKNKTRDGKTLDDWKAVVADLWENNPNLDKQKIAGAVGEFRKIYDELFQQMNESRVRNGYEPINYRRGYFPHFQPGNSDGILDAFGRALGISTEVTALPTTINGLTHTFKPGIRYMGNALERIGFNTAYDAVEGFDRYIEGAADVIYQTDNIQRLRALARQTRYRTGDEGIRKQVDDVLADPRLTEAEKTDKIDKIYENGRFVLSNFAVELDEYTNLLANKKSRYDRSMETDTGRRIYNIMKTLENRVAANMVAVNPASWLTNFIPLTQGGGVVGYRELLPAMWDTLRSYKENDGFVDRSTFLTNRRGSDPLVRSWSENMSAVASSPMSWIDSFVADSLVRARYSQNLKNGLSEAASMDEADQFVARLMADRSKGSMPTLFQRNNPLTKLFTQFQLEVNNQASFFAKDMPREYKNKGMEVLAAALLRIALGSFIFNELFSFLIGRRPAPDPIGILNDTAGDLTGYELPNMIELGTGALTGDAPDFKTERVNGYEVVANLAGNVLESTPFVGGILGGGRLPISNALPDAANLSKGLFNGELPMNKRISTVAKELGNPMTYVALPFGGGQLKKVFQGVKAVVQGGQYSLDSEGNKILQYPVYNDSLVDAVGNLVTGTLFGVTATEGGKEWIENNFKSFNAAQTETYLAMQELGVDGRTAFDLITSIRDAGKNGQGSTATQQRQVIYNSDAPGDAKAAAFYGLLAADSDKSVMDMLDGMGADMGETANALMKMKDADLMDGAAASNAKRQALVDAVLTDNQKIEIYREKISDSRDEDIFAFQDAGLNFNTFLEAQSAYSTIDKEYEGASRKALEFSRWVNQQGFTEEQAAVVKDSFAYYNMFPQSGGTYDKFISSGLSDESAYQISTALEELEPEEGEESVSKMQRYKAITNSGLSEEEQMQALSAIMKEAEYGRLKSAYDAGVTPESYVKFKEALPKYDADGKGSYKKEEVEAAIRSIPGLSNAQRAALWQSQNKTWKPAGNPFSTSVGQRVHDDLKNAAVLPKETDSDGGIMLLKG